MDKNCDPPNLTSSSPSKTHTTNTSLPCQDLLNTNACSRKAKAPNVVGMGGMNKYKNIQMKIYGWTGNQTQDPCITSQVLYHWAIQVDIHCSSSPIYHNMYSIWEYSHTQINRYPTYSYNKTQAPVNKKVVRTSLSVNKRKLLLSYLQNALFLTVVRIPKHS